jgi:AbrB family looped-hinge helix DNA binding protein
LRITERGQITIPKNLRDKYGITPATDLEFMESDKGLLLVKARAVNPLERFRGLARLTPGIPKRTDKFINAIREGE